MICVSMFRHFTVVVVLVVGVVLAGLQNSERQVTWWMETVSELAPAMGWSGAWAAALSDPDIEFCSTMEESPKSRDHDTPAVSPGEGGRFLVTLPPATAVAVAPSVPLEKCEYDEVRSDRDRDRPPAPPPRRSGSLV